MTENTNPAPDPVPAERTKHWFPSSVLALAAVFAHLPALRAGFVLDDRALIIENPYVRSLSGLPTLLRHELFIASAEPRVVPYYRPLTGLLNWLSFRVVGASPVGQHGLNLGLHALVSVLFYRALGANGIRRSVAFPTALVLAVHPVTSEIVAYLGGRQDLAGWVVLLASAWMYGRLRSTPAVVALGAGASLLGALFHEFFAFTFVPLACLALNQRWSNVKRRFGLTLVAGAGATLALMGLRSWLGLTALSAPTHNVGVMIRSCAGVMSRLVEDVLLPNDLAVDVTVRSPTLGWSVLVIGVAGVVLAAFANAVQRTRRDLFGVALAGASLIGLSASLHAGVLVMFGHISDRYAYGMLAGVLIGASAGIASWPGIPEPSPLLRVVQRWAVPALTLAMMPLTWSRDASWRDETTLQLAMIADRPLDPESRLAAGMLYFTRNDIDQAYPHCVAYARARPESEKAHLCVGTWLVIHGRADEAIPYLRRYALARPGMESARRAYLVALLAVHDFVEAQAVLDEWNVLFPDASDLAAARAELRRLREAHAVKPPL
ncbi:MAG: tetratricopeptide repeat protein [Myxococcales bacterium]